MQGQSQTVRDITSMYLTNAGFDENFNYDKTVSGDVQVDKANEIFGWTKHKENTYSYSATFEYGSGATFRGSSSKIPDSGYKDSEGGAIVLTTGWNSEVTYNQTLTLPAGSYSIVSAYYNLSAATAGASRVGWIPDEGDAVLSSLKGFLKDVWHPDTIRFFVPTGGSTGKIQIGFLATNNASSTNHAKFLIDYVYLLYHGVDKSQLDSNKAIAEAALAKTNNPGFFNKDELMEVIQAAKDVDRNDDDSVLLVIERLTVAIKEYNEIYAAYLPLQTAINNFTTNLDKIDHSESANVKFRAALTSAQAVYDNESDQRDSKIKAVLDDLAKQESLLAAYGELNENLILAESKKESYKTHTGYNDYVSSINTIKSAYEEGNLTETLIADHISDLTDQISLLDAYTLLKDAIAKAETASTSMTSYSGYNDLMASISAAKKDYTAALLDEKGIDELIIALDKAELTCHLSEESTGTPPTVVTNPDFARGSTMFFGRSTTTGTNILEEGFCWASHPEPTVLDNRSAKHYTHNGNIYYIENLTPATVYYMRAYAITTDYAVGYGDVIKVITIPRGTVTYTFDATVENDDTHGPRIKAAITSAVDYFNNLTSIQGHRLTVHLTNSATANGGYGGWMGFGPNASYQRTGTALHEMGHTIGVGTHSRWMGPSSPLRASGTRGLWLGDRANEVVRFIENNPDASLTGDHMHMWTTGATGALNSGINGAHEDSGSKLLYILNSLVHQALGEDGLPATSKSGTATPAYTFESEDNVKYYIKSEAESRGRNSAFLIENAQGHIVYKEMTASEALENDSAAWNFEFVPTTCYYLIKNTATGKYFTYKSSGTNGISLISRETPTESENFQILKSRVDAQIGDGSLAFSTRGYWIFSPDKTTLTPPTLSANTNGVTESDAFNFANTATTQRWLLLITEEVNAFDAALESVILTDLSINGKTIPSFSGDTEKYTYYVPVGTQTSKLVVSATKSDKYKGSLEISQVDKLPGQAIVKAIRAGGIDKTYTIDFIENYVYNWSGNGVTGANSDPSLLGWSSIPSVTWNTVNGSSGNRFMDPGNGQYSGYSFNGSDYNENRILWIRFKNSEEFTYDFTGLTAGNTYKLSLKYGWHNNGAVPELTIGIYEKTTKALIQETSFLASSTKRELQSGEIEFLVPTVMKSDNYYISIKNNANSDCMVILADLLIVGVGQTSSLSKIKLEDALKIVNVDEGVLISSNAHQVQDINIFSITGQMIKRLRVSTEQQFVPLSKGVYIVGNRKVIVK